MTTASGFVIGLSSLRSMDNPLSCQVYISNHLPLRFFAMLVTKDIPSHKSGGKRHSRFCTGANFNVLGHRFTAPFLKSRTSTLRQEIENAYRNCRVYKELNDSKETDTVEESVNLLSRIWHAGMQLHYFRNHLSRNIENILDIQILRLHRMANLRHLVGSLIR